MPSDSTVDSKKQFSLFDVCYYKERPLIDEFVGIKYENDKFSVSFPLGYSKPSTEKELRSDILCLISVLSSLCDKDSFFYDSDSLKDKEVEFPIHAYMWIISDFLSHGYYMERENIYKKQETGKINWPRTIKQSRPLIKNKSIFYLDYIAKKANYNENELITQIHKYCVYESFSKIGWIFCSFVPQKPELAFNARLFKAVIRNRMEKTFSEKHQELFRNMLSVIDFLDSTNESKTFYYGTDKFEHIWEKLVDSVFGEKDKEKFYPKCRWTIFSKDGKKENEVDFSNDKYRKYSLRPDTIMITERGKSSQKIFVLDSKYYKYGVSGNKLDLPSSDSIVKQFAYAEYIEKKHYLIPSDVHENINTDFIYNAFILPYNGSKDASFIECFGYASADFKDKDEKPYSKIYGIKLDIKTIMQNHTKSNEKISYLAKTILKNS